MKSPKALKLGRPQRNSKSRNCVKPSRRNTTSEQDALPGTFSGKAFTKGFKRHRADFYQDDEHPKKLWIKTLHPKAQQLLARPGELPEAHAKGVRQATAGARCALSCAQLRSLSDAFENVPDPRDPLKCRHRLRAMLTLIVHGLLCGAPDVKAIWRRAGPLNEQQRRAVGLSWRDKSGRLAMPGYDAINDVINAIDPDKLAAALNTWLVANHDNLPQSLAIDGKDLGHKLGAIVKPCEPELLETPLIMVPENTINLSKNKPVTSSDSNPVIGVLEMVTDGKKGLDTFPKLVGPGLSMGLS